MVQSNVIVSKTPSRVELALLLARCPVVICPANVVGMVGMCYRYMCSVDHVRTLGSSVVSQSANAQLQATLSSARYVALYIVDDNGASFSCFSPSKGIPVAHPAAMGRVDRLQPQRSPRSEGKH